MDPDPETRAERVTPRGAVSGGGAAVRLTIDFL